MVAITPAMKCCRRRSCSDNKFDSAEGALLATGSGLPQFQIGMDRETKFQLWIEVQKMRGTKYVTAFADPVNMA